MSTSTRGTTKRGQRIRPEAPGTPVQVRLQPPALATLDAWIALQPEPKPSRPEAVRRLINGALTKPQTRKIPDDRLTTEVGLFNYAESYFLYARQLSEQRVVGPLFDNPIVFLLIHASELYLKAYLRHVGKSVKYLQDKGHSYRKLCGSANTYGLGLSQDVVDFLADLEERDEHNKSRYIQNQLGPQIKVSDFLPVVKELRATVRGKLEAAGVRLAFHVP